LLTFNQKIWKINKILHERREKKKMGEREKKIKIALQDAKKRIKENIKKNIVTLLITTYAILIVIFNAAMLFMAGDVDDRVFWVIVVDGLNMPVMILTSLILTGKWKQTEVSGATELLIAKKDYELQLKTNEMNHKVDLKNQEIQHLQEIQTSYKTIEDLRKDLVFERTISEYQLRYVGLKANQTWIDTNKMINEIDQSIEASVKQREMNATITPGDEI
jgi:hypothetical protein